MKLESVSRKTGPYSTSAQENKGGPIESRHANWIFIDFLEA
jgi:hypothetical protein